MTQPQDEFTRVERSSEIEYLLSALSEPGGASLVIDEPEGKPWPVLVDEQHAGDHLVLDISAIREIAAQLKRGLTFRLVGQAGNTLVRTEPLVMRECHSQEGRLLCSCAYPVAVEVLQRRESFRARLRLGMEVGAIVRPATDEASLQGDLKDLSLEGCQLELPLEAASRLVSSMPMEVELCFPNGTRFALRADARHHVVDNQRQLVQVGYRFVSPTPEQERQLWFLVREIEREAARHQSLDSGSKLLPSLLFQTDSSAPPPVGRRNVEHYATPMARRLSRVAAYLDGQILDLRQGHAIGSVQLSRHADRLLALHDEDREASLFATRCMLHEPRLVQHSFAVAVQLLDLSTTRNMPPDVRKALVACALVHDLGKALLPDTLLEAPSLQDQDRVELAGHVALLLQRLETCHWLSTTMIEALVERLNERLDGSGYPQGLVGDDLGAITRLGMIVDAVDAMRRDRADRPAWPIADVYRHLLGHPEQFDQRWVKHYIKHYGLFPIGSLVRFESGTLGWVQRLDAGGRPSQILITDKIEPPDDSLSEIVTSKRLEALGRAIEEIPVST